MTTIRVEIDHARHWEIAKGHPSHMNISVFKTLKAAGIPVDGAIDMRGVMHGRLVCFNEQRDGKRFCVYEWTPMQDSIDDEL